MAGRGRALPLKFAGAAVADVHEVSDYAWLDFMSPLGYAFHPVSDHTGVSW